MVHSNSTPQTPQYTPLALTLTTNVLCKPTMLQGWRGLPASCSLRRMVNSQRLWLDSSSRSQSCSMLHKVFYGDSRVGVSAYFPARTSCTGSKCYKHWKSTSVLPSQPGVYPAGYQCCSARTRTMYTLFPECRNSKLLPLIGGIGLHSLGRPNQMVRGGVPKDLWLI